MSVKSPDDVDVQGQRIRVLRQEATMSQTDLAEQLGVTFQQVQKYERGATRVGAGRLTFQLSRHASNAPNLAGSVEATPNMPRHDSEKPVNAFSGLAAVRSRTAQVEACFQFDPVKVSARWMVKRRRVWRARLRSSGSAPAVSIEGTEEGLDAIIRMVNIHALLPPADRIQFDWLKIPDRGGFAFAGCWFV
jgi:transcriptional regulator with XRE-family HTH domain